MAKIKNIPDIVNSIRTFFEPSYLLTPEFDITIEDFVHALMLTAKRKYNTDLIIDENNKSFIIIMYKWLFNKPDSQYPINKGLIITGNVGRGKSFLTQLICDVATWYKSRVNTDFNKTIKYNEFLSIVDHHRKQTFEKHVLEDSKRINLYNDIGREGIKATTPSIDDKVIPVYGDKVNIGAAIIELEYLRFQKKGIPSIFITNYKESILKVWYDVDSISRFHEMFSFINLEGPDRRKIQN